MPDPITGRELVRKLAAVVDAAGVLGDHHRALAAAAIPAPPAPPAPTPGATPAPAPPRPAR